MAADRARLLALAEAVADGRQLDWNEAEATAQTEEDRDLVRQLHLLAGLAEAHRDVEDEPSESTRRDPSAEPKRWGPFELEACIGSGKFGAVYRAWEPQLARQVALKLLHAAPSAGEQVPAVIEEGRLLARVRHPHVITLYGADRFDGRVGIWMEFIRGRTLEDVLAQHGPLSAREAASLGVDLAAALAAVHRVNLVHRDVKTQNVMREEGGRIVLMDFGAGQELSPAGGGRGMAGTPCYMAPELFEGGQATVRSDIFSLGVLLFRVVTGEYPVPGRTATAVRQAHARGDVRRLLDVRPDLPPGFVQVVERALAHDPDARYQSAGEMGTALARAFDEPAASPRPARARRRRALFTGVALAASALLALASSTVRSQLAGLFRPTAVYDVVVLPLANLSADPAHEYFADGVTEILMSRLHTFSSFRVLARSSVAALPADARDPASLHRSLGAEYVVEGSVQRHGDRVRVTTRLVQASTGTLRWSDSYEGPLANLYNLQGEIAAAIGSAVGARLTGDTTRRLLHARQTTSAEAQDAYLQGRYLLYTFSRSGLEEARRLLERAVAIDPEYALAHASLSRAYAMMLDLDMPADRDLRELAVAAADRAIQLNPDLAETNVAFADIRFRLAQDLGAVDAAYRRALSIAPHAGIVRSPYARFLCAAGRLDEALDHARAGEQADPLSAEMIASVGIVHYYRRNHDEALRYYQRAADQSPSYGPAYLGMARALSAKGEHQKAVDQIRKAQSLVGPNASYTAELARTYAAGGWQESAEQTLGSLLLAAREPGAVVSYDGIGYAYAALGDHDRAFEWLNRATDHYFARLLFVNVDPRADPLRGDPRFTALVQRLGLGR